MTRSLGRIAHDWLALSRRPLRSALHLALLASLLASVAGAQARKVTAATFDATRPELTTLAAGSGEEAAAARARLAEGDFRVGDRFVVTLGGGEARADTMVVRDDLMVTLTPSLPDMSVRGILRSELQSTVETYVRRYVRDPVVRVYPLVRLSVLGGVARPGFYAMSPDRTLSDVIMAAGGPSASADYGKLDVTRGTAAVVDRKRAQEAVRDGSTIEELGLIAGDQIKVGEKIKRDWLTTTNMILLTVTSLISVYLLARSIN